MKHIDTRLVDMLFLVYNSMKNVSTYDDIEYRLNHPYYSLYYGGPHFKCIDLNKYIGSNLAYDKPYADVEDDIKTVVKNVTNTPDTNKNKY